MIGAHYMRALARHPRPGIERVDGTRTPLHARPGDASLVERCTGPTLDVGSGPGRLTMALAERGIPVLGIDVTPAAVHLAQTSGALTLLRDVFDRVPGTGRWMTVLLADGNIGIGGDPVALLRRVSELLTPLGQALVELQPPGTAQGRGQVRLGRGGEASAWFPWAHVGVDQVAEVAGSASLFPAETWSSDGRWFAVLRPVQPALDSLLPAPGLGVDDAVAGFLPRAYQEPDSRTRRAPSTVNGNMSFQDAPRRRRPPRYLPLQEFEDGLPSAEDTRAAHGAGNGNGRHVASRGSAAQGLAAQGLPAQGLASQGLAAEAGGPRQRPPWEDPLQRGLWDAPALPPWESGAQSGTQRSVRDSGPQPPLRQIGAQRTLRSTGAQPSLWNTGAQRALRTTGAQLPLRDSGAQRALRSTGAQLPLRDSGEQRALRSTGGQPSLWDGGAQRKLRDSGAQQAVWDAPARQQAGSEPRRSSRSVPDGDRGRPRGGTGPLHPSRGLLAGGTAGFLAAAAALGVASLTATLVRPQASPVIAVGAALTDRTPPALKNFAVGHFGENGKNVLLLGLYVAIALIAIVIGILAWRRLSIGVAGIGLFGLLGAFAVITRPESRVTDVIPSVAGGIAGITVIVILVRAWMPRAQAAAAPRRTAPLS